MQAIKNSPCEPPRVAVVASSLRLAGAEKQTVYISRALLEAGLDARFFHLGEGGYYSAALRQMGIPFLQIYKPNRPLFILTRLIGALGPFRPHIVFAPQFGDLLQAGTAGRSWNALVVGGLRSDGFYELQAHGARSRWMLALAHGLVANSHCARQNLIGEGTNPEKIRVLPNVLDLSEFDARSTATLPFSLPANRFIAAAVGSLMPPKRFDRFLEALALARRKAPALLGVIAGADRGSRPALEQRARELGLVPNHLQFLGECNNVPALLARVGCLVLCSEYEGFPNVILEAMGAGLPVITTPAGDAARIVKPDRTGFVVDGTDLQTLAERLVQLALSPETATRLGTKGRELVLQEYSYDALPFHLVSIFHEFAAQSRRGHLVRSLQPWLDVEDLNAASGRPLCGNPLG